jgi:hypothetical protein
MDAKQYCCCLFGAWQQLKAAPTKLQVARKIRKDQNREPVQEVQMIAGRRMRRDPEKDLLAGEILSNGPEDAA